MRIEDANIPDYEKKAQSEKKRWESLFRTQVLSRMQQDGWRTKVLWVGSQAGLSAIQRGQADIAGVHLYDPATREYNRPFLTPGLVQIPGYQRLQGILHRPDDLRFAGQSVLRALQTALADPHCLLVNRNPGSGTRANWDQRVGQRSMGNTLVRRRSVMAWHISLQRCFALARPARRKT